jgi:hypothetical protein
MGLWNFVRRGQVCVLGEGGGRVQMLDSLKEGGLLDFYSFDWPQNACRAVCILQ